MGLFDKKSDTLPQQWMPLTAEKQLHDIINASHQKPQVIFKDSTSCGISAGVKHRLVDDWSNIAEQADLHYLDLLSYRGISNKVAAMSGVTHQSPQIIIYHLGDVIADTSHHAISTLFIAEAVSNL